MIDPNDPYGEAEGYFASDSPPIKTIEEAERWIQILHRRSVRDANEMVRLATASNISNAPGGDGCLVGAASRL